LITTEVGFIPKPKRQRSKSNRQLAIGNRQLTRFFATPG
jgi:hypothetical protein